LAKCKNVTQILTKRLFTSLLLGVSLLLGTVRIGVRFVKFLVPDSEAED